VGGENKGSKFRLREAQPNKKKDSGKRTWGFYAKHHQFKKGVNVGEEIAKAPALRYLTGV